MCVLWFALFFCCLMERRLVVACVGACSRWGRRLVVALRRPADTRRGMRPNLVGAIANHARVSFNSAPWVSMVLGRVGTYSRASARIRVASALVGMAAVRRPTGRGGACGEMLRVCFGSGALAFKGFVCFVLVLAGVGTYSWGAGAFFVWHWRSLLGGGTPASRKPIRAALLALHEHQAIA
jgi:hypothetical protein